MLVLHIQVYPYPKIDLEYMSHDLINKLQSKWIVYEES